MRHPVRHIVLIASVLLLGGFAPLAATAEAVEFSAILECTGPPSGLLGIAGGSVGGTSISFSCVAAQGQRLATQDGSALDETFSIAIAIELDGTRVCSFSGDALPVHLTCAFSNDRGVRLQLLAH